MSKGVRQECEEGVPGPERRERGRTPSRGPDPRSHTETITFTPTVLREDFGPKDGGPSPRDTDGRAGDIEPRPGLGVGSGVDPHVSLAGLRPDSLGSTPQGGRPSRGVTSRAEKMEEGTKDSTSSRSG